MTGSKILRVAVRSGHVTMYSQTISEAGQVSPMQDEGGLTIDGLSSDSLQRRTLDALLDLAARTRGQDGHLPCLQILGEHLFELVFRATDSGDVRTPLIEALVALSSRQIGTLRLELEFPAGDDTSAWLAGLPWEYLRTPNLESRFPGQFLAMTAQLVLNRFLKLGREARNPDVHWPLRVLLVCPSPPRSEVADGLLPVDCAAVLDAIQGIGAARVTVDTRLIEGPAVMSETWRPRVTWEAFRKAIQDVKPNIIHFVGHGRRQTGGGQLAFLKDGGEIDWRWADEVAGRVSEADHLRLVFLQACESAQPDPYLAASSVAQRIASLGIPAVVAMQHRIDADVANAFAMGFYLALAAGENLDSAVGSGRERIRAMHADSAQLEFGVPVLYLQSYEGIVPRTSQERLPQMGSVGKSQKCSRCRRKAEELDRFCGRCHAALFCPNEACRSRLTTFDFCTVCSTAVPQPRWSPPDRARRPGWSGAA